jgi:hypothetical protein
MIVGYQPGGSIKDSRVVLKPDEKLPNRFNIPEAIVYAENPDNPREWLLVKPLHQVLPQDSPLLSQPELPELDIFSLTTEENPDTLYEHNDIIRLDEEADESNV